MSRRPRSLHSRAGRPGFHDEPDDLNAEQTLEVIRRRELALARPGLLEPWDGTVECLRERLHEFRRQKTASR